MTASASTRLSKLERSIRSKAREEFVTSVDADFEPTLNRTAANDGATKLIKEARAQFIKQGQRAAEDAALESFLSQHAPAPAPLSLDALYNPVQVRIAANGERLPDTAEKYAAVLLPQFDLLYTAETWLADNWKAAVKLGSEVELFDGKGEWQLWDDIEAGLTIDRGRHSPAVLSAFVSCTPTDYIYWTRRPYASSPSGSAFVVYLRSGHVSWLDQGYRGRVRACRRVRASQF